MTENYIINRSPALTFAKLNMNGDNVELDNALLSQHTVKTSAMGGLVATGTYTGSIPSSASGEDIDQLLSSEQHLYELQGNAEVTLLAEDTGVIRRVIQVPFGAEVSLIEVARGGADTVINSTVYFVEEGAHLKLIRLQLLSKNTRYIDDLRAELGKDASLDVIRLDLGSAVSYIASNVLLDGKNSEYKALGNYLLNGTQRLDINMIATHIAPNTVSDMRADGVLDGASSKIFRGALDFKSGCKGAKGAENEDVVMLSEDADNQSLPIILCGEEDVEGNHGASVGKISEEILYYLACRGFDEEAATRLIIRSRFNGVLEQIGNDELRAEVTGLIDEALA